MVISKFICIPLLILVPLTILFFESRSRDFTQPPSDAEVTEKVAEWKATNPRLNQTGESTDDKAKVKTKNHPNLKPKAEENEKGNTPSLDEAVSADTPQPAPPKVEDATKGIDLNLSPSLNHLQGMRAKRLKLLIQQLDPNLYPELIYLANERLLDSAPDSSIDDIHAAGAYLNKHPRPLWNPEASLRVPLTVQISVDAAHYDKAKSLAQQIETNIFWGSGGTVKPKVSIQKSATDQNSITLSGKKGSVSSAIPALSDATKMIENAVQIAVTKAVADQQLPILYTDKIHYTYFSRLTWLTLAKSL